MEQCESRIVHRPNNDHSVRFYFPNIGTSNRSHRAFWLQTCFSFPWWVRVEDLQPVWWISNLCCHWVLVEELFFLDVELNQTVTTFLQLWRNTFWIFSLRRRPIIRCNCGQSTDRRSNDYQVETNALYYIEIFTALCWNNRLVLGLLCYQSNSN